MIKPTEQQFPLESIRELDPDSWNPREILGDVELAGVPTEVYAAAVSAAIFVAVSLATRPPRPSEL